MIVVDNGSSRRASVTEAGSVFRKPPTSVLITKNTGVGRKVT